MSESAGIASSPGFLDSLLGLGATLLMLVASRLIERYLPLPPPPEERRRRRRAEREERESDGQ